MKERIYVDFNTMNQDLASEEPRVSIGRHDIPAFVREGLRVIVGDEDLEVEAILEFDSENEVWWARPDWSTRRYLSR